MQNLRRQLLLSHLLLIGLMLLLLAGGVLRFFHLGRSIDRVLDANVKSVLLMQQTKDALSAQPVRLPEAAFAIQQELGNITEPGEGELAEALRDGFDALRTGTGDRKQVSAKAQEILELNLAAMRRADAEAKHEARQSALLGAAATVGAAVLAVLLARRAVQGALLPLVSLARQAEEVGEGRLNQRIELTRSDEIGTLARAFNGMSEKLAEARAALEARLIRAERMNDAALESLYDPVIVTDAAGRLVHLNRAAESLLGQPLGTRLGEARLAQAVDTALQEGKTVAPDDSSALVGLKDKTFRLRVSPMRTESEPLGAVIVLEDITSLQEVDRLKTEFISVASHELRTPVTSLLLSVQLLQEGAVGTLTAPQSQLIQAQRDDLERLERLLRELLDLTKLESGASPPQLEAVAARSLCTAALDGIRAEAGAQGVSLAVGTLTETLVWADTGQLTRVLTNLLGNAIRHTPRGGTVTLEARELPSEVIVTVSDTGSGIPQEYLSEIFGRFTQVPGATRGGAGLGLSLAKAIVEAHGGTIAAQSAGVGKGSAFIFTLPRTEKTRE
ncbi:sensor histidine kinase [Armatimonas rosea]|uniref:histidine kinase n=1 Tax=Armatimonas rosea TaxID=685828 RepID=A0A7W9SST9_ARMRO|nr:ATP-binding protein [Armatimonas rosea]MBB6052212.1 signal transduction histidine kinase [Armatimonas rosea]